MGPPDGWVSPSVLDRGEVGGIAPSLTSRSRVYGNAQRLQANRDRSFQGSNVLGMGFVLAPDEAEAMIAANRRNAEVVRPYLFGEDLNSRPGRLAITVGDRFPRLAAGASRRVR